MHGGFVRHVLELPRGRGTVLPQFCDLHVQRTRQGVRRRDLRRLLGRHRRRRELRSALAELARPRDQDSLEADAGAPPALARDDLEAIGRPVPI